MGSDNLGRHNSVLDKYVLLYFLMQMKKKKNWQHNTENVSFNGVS